MQYEKGNIQFSFGYLQYLNQPWNFFIPYSGRFSDLEFFWANNYKTL